MSVYLAISAFVRDFFLAGFLLVLLCFVTLVILLVLILFAFAFFFEGFFVGDESVLEESSSEGWTLFAGKLCGASVVQVAFGCA